MERTDTESAPVQWCQELSWMTGPELVNLMMQPVTIGGDSGLYFLPGFAVAVPTIPSTSATRRPITTRCLGDFIVYYLTPTWTERDRQRGHASGVVEDMEDFHIESVARSQ